ncbi:hypothetical protein niasHT_028342 [Heterodera trifolii]|uniref:Uncharacterized protein n=1 Tax=Heterodera trifolii TaxID=157864 RepID=A0ABD2KSM6_9BILA
MALQQEQQQQNVLGQMPPFGQVAQLVQPILINAAQQQIAEPFCADGTHNQRFLNGCVAELGQLLPPLCLIVVSVDHRAAQQTTAGPLPVTNCVLRTGDGHRVEASGWQASAHVLASLTIGDAYWFINCVARPRFQRLGCRFRVGVGGPNALVVPHVAPQLTANIPPMLPVQIGAGPDAIRVPPPPNVTNDGDDRRADLNNNDNVGLEPCLTGARQTQRRAAEPVRLRVRFNLSPDVEEIPGWEDQKPYSARKIRALPTFDISPIHIEKSLSCPICMCSFEIGEGVATSIEECFVIERTTAMRNVPRNTRGEICELRFRPMEETARPDLLMEALIQRLLDRVLEGLPSPSLVGLQLHPPGFEDHLNYRLIFPL